MIEVRVRTILTYIPLMKDKKEQYISLEENSIVKDLLDLLVHMYGEAIGEVIFDKADPSKVNPGNAILLNGRNVFALEGLGTRLSQGDLLQILPPIAGG